MKYWIVIGLLILAWSAERALGDVIRDIKIPEPTESVECGD